MIIMIIIKLIIMIIKIIIIIIIIIIIANKCRLCGDRDETINYMISECNKFTQKKYKTRHDWVGKGIH